MTSPDQQTANRLTVRDPVVMRAMAHPARLAIIEYLGEGNQATATECAQVVGLSPSATSYHLRALAKAGLVKEAPSRGDGRERVWRGVAAGVRVEMEGDESPELASAAYELMKVILARDEEQIDRWIRNAATEPKEWFDAAGMTRHQLMITADELTELFAEVHRLLARYGRLERPVPPPGARRVGVLFRAVPTD